MNKIKRMRKINKFIDKHKDVLHNFKFKSEKDKLFQILNKKGSNNRFFFFF